MADKFCKLEVFVPEEYAEKVKTALGNAGAGRLGNYDFCFWQSDGTGQFRPLAGSDPFIGKTNEIERVREVKIETLFPENIKSEIIAAIRASHPYETPAYYIMELIME